MSKVILPVFLLLLIFSKTALAQKYDAEVLRYSTTCEVQDRNKLILTDSVTIQINSREGEDYTEISIPYSKMEKISDLEAWIENSQGVKIRNLKKSEIQDKSAISGISLYEDNFQKCFQLKDNNYPYKIFYTYKYTLKEYITIADWTPVLFNRIPIRQAILWVIMPKDFVYKEALKNISSPQKEITKSSQILKWNLSWNTPLRQEIFSKRENEIPEVIISPLTFNYGLEGSLESWQTYGNWQYRLLKGLDVLPDSEKKIVSSLIEGVSDRREIVKILYHYLQDQTHYIYVKIGIGGLKPYPASYVALNKYGDCKALSNYMKAILAFAGIESYYVKVKAGEQPTDLIKNFTGQQFNHAILAVPLDKDTIWLENTSSSCPFGYMGPFTQNRQALLISENSSHLVHIPALKKEDIHTACKMDFYLNLNNAAKVSVTNYFKGSEFEHFNQIDNNLNDKAKDEYIRDYMPFTNYEVISWNLAKMNRDTSKIELKASLNLYKFLNPLGSEFYFNLYPFHLPSFTNEKDRTLPVSLPYPIFVSDTLFYHLPKGYTLKTTPEPVSLSSGYGRYNSAVSLDNGCVKVIKSYELFPGEYSLKEYPELYSFIRQIKEKDISRLIIKPNN